MSTESARDSEVGVFDCITACGYVLVPGMDGGTVMILRGMTPPRFRSVPEIEVVLD